MATLNNTQAQGKTEDKASFWSGLIKLEHGLIFACFTAFVVGTVVIVGGGYTLLHWLGWF